MESMADWSDREEGGGTGVHVESMRETRPAGPGLPATGGSLACGGGKGAGGNSGLTFEPPCPPLWHGVCAAQAKLTNGGGFGGAGGPEELAAVRNTPATTCLGKRSCRICFS